MSPNHLSISPSSSGMAPWIENLAKEFGRLKDPKHVGPLLASFNLAALRQQASLVAGKPCTQCIPFGQGGYNTAFLLEIAGGPNLVGRMGGSIYGDMRKYSDEQVQRRFESEIATMEYIRKHTSIPVPRIYHYDVTPTNSVGARYMILELISGCPLDRVWDDITPQQRKDVLGKVMELEIQLLRKPFSVSGCLVDQDGTVGSLCQPSRTDSNLDDSTLDGPLTCYRDYLATHCASTLSKLRCVAASEDSKTLPSYAVQWFTLALSAIQTLPASAGKDGPAQFFLFHDDLEMQHVFVSPSDPTQILGVIDWEGSRIAPFWDLRFHSTFLNQVRIDADYGSISREEADSLFAQRDAALAEAGFGSGSVSTTKLWLERLMYLIDVAVGDVQLRGWAAYDFEELYLEWYEDLRRTGHLSQAEMEGFEKLASFIKDYKEEGRNRTSAAQL